MHGFSNLLLYLLTFLSACMLAFKTNTKEQLFLGKWFYTDLSALAILFGVIVSIAVILIVSQTMKN